MHITGCRSNESVFAIHTTGTHSRSPDAGLAAHLVSDSVLRPVASKQRGRVLYSNYDYLCFLLIVFSYFISVVYCLSLMWSLLIFKRRRKLYRPGPGAVSWVWAWEC